jgi:hypothetical protein
MEDKKVEVAQDEDDLKIKSTSFNTNLTSNIEY